jgi:hypothetical protein
MNEIFFVSKINFDGVEDGEVHLHIHKANSKAVLIMYPGADGSVDGYNKKYQKIANLIQSKNIATVIRLDNKYCCAVNLPYCELMINKLAQVIEYVFDNAEKIAGHKEIEIYLSGASAGAGAIATILDEFPMIKKVLFIAPAPSVGLENIKRGLKSYRGELYLTAGEDDEINAVDTAQLCYDTCELALKKELEIIPQCNHQFTGKRNGQIMANSYLWAFAEEGNFPSHIDGIVLYE